jgi:hypothetical protein
MGTLPQSRKMRPQWALLAAVAVLGLCAFQYGDNYGLNNMRYAQVQGLVADLGRAEKMAKQGNVEYLAGQELKGKPVRLHGELTDANCYLGAQTMDYDHAFCAKLCAAAGSPLLFIPDDGRQVYVVLTAKNGVKLPDGVLDRIGVPGVMVEGVVVEADGLHGLAVQRLGQ